MTTTPQTQQTLTLSDRCDRCSAAARIRFDLNGLDLQFCSHHGRANRDALATKGATVLIDLDLVEGVDAAFDAIQ